MNRLNFICDFGSSETGRLDRVVQQWTGLSRAGVRGLVDHQCVTVNGEIAKSAHAAVHNGDAVAIQYDPNRRYREQPKARSDPAFEILFQDEHLLVVNKAAHVLTVPDERGKGKTLIDALQKHVSRARSRSQPGRLRVVHRLDRGVSGVLVVAKSDIAGEHFKKQFAAHKPNRVYIAIVAGVMEKKRGTFRSHLVTNAALTRRSSRKPEQGELAVTHYQAISSTGDATVVRVQLETGRRNQIRVHFAEAGHPVLGDRRYRPDLSSHPRWKARRLALHAASLEFEHPATGRSMRFEAELPREFAAFHKAGSVQKENRLSSKTVDQE